MKTIQQIIRIGDWEILPETNQIQNHRTSFFLTPRLMRLFVFLMEHPNVIVTKEELMESVWEERIVTENLLTKSISELRQVIQENLHGLMKIETIRSVGYILHCDGDLEFSNEHRNGISTSVLDRNRNWSTGQTTLLKLLSGLGFILLLVFFFWKIFPSKSVPPQESYKVDFSPISSKTGIEWQAAISPEGANLVYAWREDQSEFFYLNVRHLESSTARRLTMGENNYELNPVWSPDGQKIAFLKEGKQGQYDLYLIPLAGGEEELLAQFEFEIVKPNMVWTTDQNQLIFSAKKAAELPLTLFSFDMETKQFQQLTSPLKNIYGDHFPNRLPDGRLAFARSDFGKSLLNPKAPGKGKIILLDLKSGKKQTIADVNQEITGMAYSKPLKKLIYWLVVKDGYEYELQAFPLNGKTEYITSVHTNRPSNLIAHPVAPFLIYEAWGSLMNIHIVKDSLLKPFLHSTHWDWHPRFSKDGQKIAFLSSRNGPIQVWLSDKNYPKQAVPVSTFESRSLNWLSLSPDGETVVLQGIINGKDGLFKLEVKTKKITPLKSEPFAFAYPEFSPDGKSIYYASDKSGEWQIWRCNLLGNEDEMITTNGGFKAIPINTYEGTVIFYAPFKGAGLWKMNIETRTEKQIFPDQENFDKTNFAITDKGIYYYQWKPGGCYLKYFDFANKTVDEIMHLNGIVLEVPSLAVGKDGTILISLSDKIKSDLVKIEIGR